VSPAGDEAMLYEVVQKSGKGRIHESGNSVEPYASRRNDEGETHAYCPFVMSRPNSRLAAEPIAPIISSIIQPS
jgi:hypothetical protein